jgi:hypothetical protein
MEDPTRGARLERLREAGQWEMLPERNAEKESRQAWRARLRRMDKEDRRTKKQLDR